MLRIPDPADRFEVVPLLRGGNADDVAAGIRRWIDSEALQALVSEFGGESGPVPAQSLGARLAWLDEFSARWDYRGGRERNLASVAEFDGPQHDLVLAAADALGLTGLTPPSWPGYDHVLVLGGLVRACIARPLHAARLLSDGVIEAGDITALGGFRPLAGDELTLAEILDEGPLVDEFDAMDAGIRRAFAVDQPVEERGETSDVLGASWRVRSYRTASGLPVEVIAAPSSEPGVRRANTPDTYAWFAGEVARLRPGQRLLIITTAIYVPFQHANALRMFSLPYGVDVDTVGVRPGDLDPQLAQEFLPHHYLQEVRSTIRALRDLHRAIEPAG